MQIELVLHCIAEVAEKALNYNAEVAAATL
jgi:hypothetical protein